MRAPDRTFTGRRPVLVPAAAGGAGLLAFAVGVAIEPERAYFAYLAAWAFGVSLALGALSLLMIAHVTGARWFVVVRRPAEALVATLPAFALLFVPLLFGLDDLYPWLPPLDGLEEPVREAVREKRAYLNRPFFLVRSGAYLATWIVLGGLLWRWSAAQDEGDGRRSSEAGTRKPVVLSAVGLPLFGFTVTFAAFDWLMSLAPRWYSTLFGVYFWTGGFVACLAGLVLLVRTLQRSGALGDGLAADHYHALGRLLLTFVLLWAYVAFSQGFVVWIADLPVEAEWYLARWEGGWSAVLTLLVVGHFALPFLALLSRPLKRNPRALGGVAIWLLAMHYVDVYWVVIPALGGPGPELHWLDLATLVGILGVTVAAGAWWLGSRAPVARGDPRLAESTSYRSS